MTRIDDPYEESGPNVLNSPESNGDSPVAKNVELITSYLEGSRSTRTRWTNPPR